MDREVKRWITVNGHHMPIFENSNVNKSGNISLSDGINVSYERMLSLEEKRQMIDEFSERTGISIQVTGLQEIPDDTFELILNTVENHINEYGRNNFLLTQISMREDDFTEGDREDSMATMGTNGVLSLNPAYFKRPKKELDEVMARCAESSFHPQGDASSIIIHELGHARFNNAMINMWREGGGTADEWVAMYNQSTDRDWMNSIDIDRYRTHKAYSQFIDKIDAFTERLRDSDYLRKQWGGRPALGLRGLVDPNYNFADGVSRYAATNLTETMAESWADVMYNGDKASWLSKQIVAEFLSVEETLYI